MLVLGGDRAPPLQYRVADGKPQWRRASPRDLRIARQQGSLSAAGRLWMFHSGRTPGTLLEEIGPARSFPHAFSTGVMNVTCESAASLNRSGSRSPIEARSRSLRATATSTIALSIGAAAALAAAHCSSAESWTLVRSATVCGVK